MPCTHFAGGIVCYSRPRRKRCKFCCALSPGNFVSRLCDFEVAPGKTCDAEMCIDCARPVGPDIDFCPDHSGERTMGQHFTKNTLETTAYCGRCKKDTQHRVDGGRKGPCLSCIARLEAGGPQLSKKQERSRRDAEHERQNPRLF